VHRWNSANTARRACLILGALVAVFGVAQLIAIAVWSTLASAWANAIAAEGLPGALPGAHAPFELFLRLGLAWQVLLIVPIIVGVGGILVYGLGRPLIGQVVVILGTAAAAIAAIPRIDLGSPNTLSLWQMAYPVEGITAVPFCLALVVFALSARSRDSSSVATRSAPSA
jgi:hypothetical protein